MRIFLTLGLLAVVTHLQAQFAPQAMQPGSTAIHKDSAVFKDWAHTCTVVTGWMDASNVSLGTVSNGSFQDALGYPDGSVVSLGDMGEAVYYFENPIVDSPGYDFALFENGFINSADSNMAYLELAYVEVSNDGIHYVRFPSTCNNDTTVQIAGSGEYMDARKINNLAGKYISNYGTPFDLFELAFSSSLQLDNIRYVKVIDVVGSIQKNICGRDAYQHIINDPYPTPFTTGGFDLDALGIIHQKFPTNTNTVTYNPDVQLFPIPVKDKLNIQSLEPFSDYEIHDLSGRMVQHGNIENHMVSVSDLPEGTFFITCSKGKALRVQRLFLKW